jgi:hypothetical protein
LYVPAGTLNERTSRFHAFVTTDALVVGYLATALHVTFAVLKIGCLVLAKRTDRFAPELSSK